jgi:molybdopterin/thiamine biosynthesis adenylyltransferase
MAFPTIRHEPLFSPHAFHPRTVTVFGLGAGGSHTCFELGKLGIRTIIGCDYQEVAIENVGPSIYGVLHVGRPKAEVCAEILAALTSGALEPHVCKAQELQNIGDVVFICVDSMQERKRILYEQCVPNAGTVARVIEGRMSAESIRVHSIDPGNAEHLKEWDRYWFPDEEALPALMACGERPVATGYAAGIAGRIAVALLVQWFASLSQSRPLVNQVRYDLTTFEGRGYIW